ncbi:hypothetical protein [Asticcacaulis benevestitus]|uniref:STAS/SEC14 domain-containing protein n=1 Tax=Asticcacaulis benevestitus DSM 16100 = ATCC BAA-896 TaxID=1121022 RepID=V4Q8X1_9CAUL|nr:hypothetical protein [Asticcacaulis benevestitus]ESQ94315.1 hypothetical protein ABENE_02080 [Asticcacaulis benevestitus DSM 16100 = ATCC BAA-896]
MIDPYFKLTVDEPQKLVTMRFKGAQSSQYYTERIINAYGLIDRPWLYRRLMDYRNCETSMSFPDVERMAVYWADLTRGQNSLHYVAILATDALTRARTSTYSHLFPNQDIHTFTELHDALDWLLAMPVSQASQV